MPAGNTNHRMCTLRAGLMLTSSTNSAGITALISSALIGVPNRGDTLRAQPLAGIARSRA